MQQSIVPLIASTVGALGLDALWLTYRSKYHNTLFESIQKSPLEVRILPAIVVYAMIPIATFFFGAKQSTSIYDALYRGAIIGFFLYGFYDATNFATLKNWTLFMSITDTLWGIFLCSIVCAIGYITLRPMRI
jgi:uncharacterized membrane protein